MWYETVGLVILYALMAVYVFVAIVMMSLLFAFVMCVFCIFLPGAAVLILSVFCLEFLRHCFPKFYYGPLRHQAVVSLENYCYSMKNTLQEEKLQDKFDAGDKDKIESAVQECLDWLERNQMAETEEFEAKQKELEGVVNPIMMKVYQSAGGGGMPDMGGGMGGGAPPGGAGGPTVEEVD